MGERKGVGEHTGVEMHTKLSVLIGIFYTLLEASSSSAHATIYDMRCDERVGRLVGSYGMKNDTLHSIGRRIMLQFL